jgi:hypothetical protein
VVDKKLTLLYEGTNTSFDVEELTPQTEYKFGVSSYNKNPSGEESNLAVATITTRSAPPEGVPTPDVSTVEGTGTKLDVTIAEPDTPNGDIKSYLIILDGTPELLVDEVGDYTVTALTPNTMYEISYRACTVGGCTTSSVVKIKTNPAPPTGLSAPTLGAYNASAMNISWTGPSSPNGDMVGYNVERNLGDGEVEVVFEDVEVEPSDEYFVVEIGLNIYTKYGYRIVAFNDEGKVTSAFATGFTGEAAPAELAAPKVKALDAEKLQVDWKPPSEPNGGLTKYQVLVRIKGKSQITEAYSDTDEATTAVITKSIRPAVTFEVSVVFHNAVGKVQSDWVEATTPESLPDAFPNDQPEVSSPRYDTVEVAWNCSQFLNGKLTKATITLYEHGARSKSRVETVEGDLAINSHNITDLEPNKKYDFKLTVCTAQGCTVSNRATAVTIKTEPQAMKAIEVRALSSTTVDVSWTEPNSPNQPIIFYTVIHESEMIYNGTDTEYVANATAGAKADFVVRAYNNHGFTASETASVQMPEDSPELLASPNVTVISSESFDIVWDEPGLPNGIIVNYSLYHTPDDSEDDPEVLYTGLGFNYTLESLDPFTKHYFRMEACTTVGCSFSSQTAGRTDEAKPEGMHDPEMESTGEPGYTTMQIAWDEPDAPNGIIEYEVYLRGELSPEVYGDDNHEVVGTPALGDDEFFDLLDPANNNFTRDNDDSSEDGYVFEPSNNESLILTEANEKLSGSFSIALEVNQTQSSDGGQYLFAKSDDKGRRYFSVYTTATSGQLYFFYRKAGSTRVYPARFSKKLTDGKSHRLLFTVVNDTQLTLRVDDDFEQHRTLVGPVDDCGNITETCLFQVGSLPLVDVTNNVQYFNGSMTGAAIFPEVVLDQHPNFTAIAERRRGKNATIGYQWRVVYNGTDRDVEIPGVYPFRQYTTYVVAATSAGAAKTNVVSLTTPEAPPTEVSAPNAQLVAATISKVTWQSPGRMNGKLLAYRVDQYDATRNKMAVLYQGKKAGKKIVAGLKAYTDYQYRLSARTAGGATLSEWSNITTPDGTPADFESVQVNSSTPRTLFVRWEDPSTPEGLMIKYTVFQGDNQIAELADDAGVFEELGFNQSGLNPAQQYQFSVIGCNRVACVVSEVAAGTTDPDFPDSLAPGLTALSASTVLVKWGKGQSGDYATFGLNGKLVAYELSRREKGKSKVTDLTITTTTGYLDRGLKAGVEYEYFIAVTNEVGKTVGDWTTIRTKYLPPSSVGIPSVEIEQREVTLSWPEPTTTYGAPYFFELVEKDDDGETLRTFNTNNTNITAGDLKPNTPYRYLLKVCNVAGCRPSSAVNPQTLIASPEAVSDPELASPASDTMQVCWIKPSQPNGKITNVSVHLVDPVSSFDVYPRLTGCLNVTELDPYTSYSFFIKVCTLAGCTPSKTIAETTAEDAPEDQPTPTLKLGKNGLSVNVAWDPPSKLNGVLRSFSIEFQRVEYERRERRQGEDSRAKAAALQIDIVQPRRKLLLAGGAGDDDGDDDGGGGGGGGAAGDGGGGGDEGGGGGGEGDEGGGGGGGGGDDGGGGGGGGAGKFELLPVEAPETVYYMFWFATVGSILGSFL